MGKSSPTSGKEAAHVAHRPPADPRPDRRRRHHRRPQVTVKGPKGTLSHTVVEPITHRARRGRHAASSPARTTSARAAALHGLTRTLVANMVVGVTDGYEKTLEIRRRRLPRRRQGLRPRVRARLQPPGAGRAAGGHHLRGADARRGSSCAGIDKQKVGEVAANIRKLRKPDPYKGKGVRYAGRGRPPQGREDGEVMA